MLKSDQAGGNLINTLKQISKGCETCQSLAMRSIKFRSSIPPDKIIFKHELATDLVLLEGIPTVHVVDTHIHFQSAVHLWSKLADDI